MNVKTEENSNSSALYLVHDGTVELEPLSKLAPTCRLIGLQWTERDKPPAGARVLVNLDITQIRELAPLAIERKWEIGLLPHPGAEQATRALGVKGNIADVFAHYASTEAVDADVLVCNDQIVFSAVVIGEVLSLRPYAANRPPQRGAAFLDAFKAMKDLRLVSHKLTTGKEQKVHLAALGLVIMEHTQSTLIGRCFSDALSISDGRLTLLALAPRSILSYLWFLLRLLLPKQISLSRLPGAIGLIRSDRVLLEAPRGVDYSLDGTLLSAKEVDFRIQDEPLRLLPGPAFLPREGQKQTKDTIKLSHVPVDDTARQLHQAPLPFFSHASEEEYRGLFVSLRENATTSSHFLVLMVLSVLLALAGLYANSAPVIIGAMILAPLMSPIVSLAMGLARTEPTLIRNSLQTLAIGIGSGLLCAVAVAWLMPLENVTTEMRARLSPTLIDLSIAVISGMAGAYAHAKEEIAKSLAGVAIAVALVPPLSVAGIGVGWGDWVMAKGAFLLFVTNLVGISLAASATFLIMGFAPFKLAKKGIAITLLLVSVIVGPLYIAFADLVDQENMMEEIPTGQVELAGALVDLRIVDVTTGTPPLIRVVMSASTRLDERHVDALKQIITTRIGHDVLLEAQLNLRR